jgi:hypothetical protein
MPQRDVIGLADEAAFVEALPNIEVLVAHLPRVSIGLSLSDCGYFMPSAPGLMGCCQPLDFAAT